jgi:type I restriction enzyme S subunit
VWGGSRLSQFDELPEGWVNVSLFEISRPKQWQTISKKELSESGYPVYGANGKIGFFNNYNHEKSTILITCRGATCGTLNISEPYAWINGNAMALDELNEEIIEFFYAFYALKARGFKDTISGSAQPQITREGLENVTLSLPPLNEQRRIVEKIEALTDRSRKARAALDQIPALLDQFRQSVLAAAFRGDLTADWRAQNPDVEPAEALLERIRVERRQHWEEAELEKMKAKGTVPKDSKWKEKYKEPIGLRDTSLTQLPDDWIWANVAQLSSSMLGKMLDKVKHQSGKLLPYLRNVNVRWGSIDTSDVLAMYFEDDEHERYSVKKGDVLICEGGEPGRAAVWENHEEIKYQKALHRLRALGGINPYWFVYHLWFDAITGSLDQHYTGSTIKHFTGISLAGYPIRLPSTQEQNEIVKRVSKILQLTDSFLEQYLENAEELGQLDQSILAKAFRGELVPQDPNDEPAAVLLDRIRAERERLSSSKKRGKAKA